MAMEHILCVFICNISLKISKRHKNQKSPSVDVLIINYQQCCVAKKHVLVELSRLKFFINDNLGGGFKYFLFSSLFGEDFQFD